LILRPPLIPHTDPSYYERIKEFKAPLGDSLADTFFCWKCKQHGHKPGDRLCPFTQLTMMKSEQLRRGVEDPVGAFLSLVSRRGEGGTAAAAAAAAAGGGEEDRAGQESLAEQLERELAAEYDKWKQKRARKEERRQRKKHNKEGRAEKKRKKGRRRSRSHSR
jgi:hypothetical protein